MERALCIMVGILSLFICIIKAERVQCGGIISPITSRRVVAYVCPTKLHREKENRCCDPPEFNCCREATFFENHLIPILSSTVIVTFASLAIVIAVCLCWEKCFLHKLVRKKPTLDYIARPEETEHLNSVNVPGEYSDEKQVYEVNSNIVYQSKKTSL